MIDSITLLFWGTYFLLFVSFAVFCVNSIRSVRHLKRYSRTMEEIHRRSETNHQILWTDYAKAIRDLTQTVESLEKKVDELRLQVGIINGRMGDYSRVISVPPTHALTDANDRPKGGWPKGKARKPKQIAQPPQETE